MAWTRWQDWSSLVLGSYLLFVPLLFGLGGAAATTTYLVATSIVLVSLWALAQPDAKAALWCNLLLGAGFAFAPIAFGFAGNVGAAWSAYIVGAAVAVHALLAYPFTGGLERRPG